MTESSVHLISKEKFSKNEGIILKELEKESYDSQMCLGHYHDKMYTPHIAMNTSVVNK